MGIKSFVRWFKNTSRNIDEHDGRVIKIGDGRAEISAEEKQVLETNKIKTVAATTYLTQRGRHMLTCPNFKYVPAVSTDIKTTMRTFIDETMPDAKETYSFLYPAT